MDEPGQLIIPHEPGEPKTGADDSPEPERPAEQPTPPAPSPLPSPEPNATPLASSIEPQPIVSAAEPVTPTPVIGDAWFQQEPASLANTTPDRTTENLTWTASEYIAHEKGAAWYLSLIAGTIVITAIIYLLTKDKISTTIVLLTAITFGVFAGRKPRTQQYSLSGQGLQIGQKFYGLQDFKTFSISIDGAIASIVLNPLKRFMPPLTIYVAPDLEEKVMDFLSDYLPFEQHKADAVDSLLKRIRF